MAEQDSQLPFYKAGFDPLQQVDYERGAAFMEFLKQKQFYLRDINVSPKIFNQWKRYGLITENIGEQRKWVTLDFGQYLWLSIIKDLRKFGVPLEDIKRIKDTYTVDYYKEVQKAIPQEKIENLWKSVLDGLPNFTAAQIEEAKRKFSGEDVIREAVNKLAIGDSNFLEVCIMHMVILGEPVYITLFLTDDNLQKESEEVPPAPVKENGKRKKAKRESCIEFIIDMEQYKNMTNIDQEKLQSIYETPHIKLPLRKYIREFIGDTRNEKRLENSTLVSQEELILLKELRKDNVAEITIKMQQKKDSSQSTINRINLQKCQR